MKWTPVPDSEVTRGLTAMIVFNGLNDYADCRLCRQVPRPEAGAPEGASVSLWSYERIRQRAETWEMLWVGQANMPAADYIEAAMCEIRDDYEDAKRVAASVTPERVAALEYALERADFSELRGHEVLVVLDAMLKEMKGATDGKPMYINLLKTNKFRLFQRVGSQEATDVTQE